MSWSISATLPRESDDIELWLRKVEALVPSGNENAADERDDQVKAAKAAVSQILQTGGFENANEISVAMSGHANKDHKYDKTYSNDFINITVAIRSYKDAEPKPA